ncbi:MAG: ArsR/SmtB family transcription factor [Streptosporangiales bacterium]
MSDDDLLSRLDQIEARLAQLEANAEDAAPAGAPKAERFWALNRLKELLPDPGGVLFAGAVTIGDEPYEWQEGRPLADVIERDWSEFATTLSALAHPVRLALLLEIVRGHRTAAELGADERFGTSGQLYHHLRQLVAAGWLKSTGRGRYAVPPKRVVPLLVIVMGADR